jgi:hypothetical protein
MKLHMLVLKIYVVPLTVPNNDCCTRYGIDPCKFFCLSWLCWDFISLISVSICINCVKFVPLCCILYKLLNGSFVQLVGKRFNTGLVRHSEILLLLSKKNTIAFGWTLLFVENSFFFSAKKSPLRSFLRL